MQCLDASPRVFSVTIILHDIIRNTQAFFPAGLRSDHAPRLLLIFGIPGQKTAELDRFTAVDDQYPVHEICHRRSEQQWHDDYQVRTARFRHALVDGITNSRVQYVLDLPALRIVGKYDFSHCPAIQGTARLKYCIAEDLTDFVKRRCARGDDLPRDHVRIDNRHPEIRKIIGDSRLAAGYATGEPDAKWTVC